MESGKSLVLVIQNSVIASLATFMKVPCQQWKSSLKVNPQVCVETHSQTSRIFSICLFFYQKPIHLNKMISTCRMPCQSPRPRDPVHGDPREPHPRAPTLTAASTAHLQLIPGLRCPQRPLLSCRLSNRQPPLIPALRCLQIKFQLFVNLCENDKPVAELSFNTQKYK